MLVLHLLWVRLLRNILLSLHMLGTRRAPGLLGLVLRRRRRTCKPHACTHGKITWADNQHQPDTRHVPTCGTCAIRPEE